MGSRGPTRVLFLTGACRHATAPFVYHVPVGSCEVPHNPEGAAHTSSTRTTAITVPGNSFCPNGTGLVRSYVLLLRVTAGGLVNEGDTGGQCCFFFFFRFFIRGQNNERSLNPIGALDKLGSSTRFR